MKVERGLSTALSIVKGHGGFVEVHSREDKGSEIAVCFPAVVDSGRQTHLAEAVEVPEGRGQIVSSLTTKNQLDRLLKLRWRLLDIEF